MLIKLFTRSKPELADETPLSRFVHRASSAEKKRVYNLIIKQASEEQRNVIKSFRQRQAAREEQAPV